MNSLSVDFGSETSEVVHDECFFSGIDDVVAAGGAD